MLQSFPIKALGQIQKDFFKIKNKPKQKTTKQNIPEQETQQTLLEIP